MSNTSTPGRYKKSSGLTVGGWAYADDEQTRFAFICSAEGFGLPSFDDFIDSLPGGIAKQELLDWRKNAFNAFKNSNRAALRGWLQAAYTNWRARLTIVQVQPTVSMGLNQQRGSETNQNNAEIRNKYLKKKYAGYRKLKFNKGQSREKANTDMVYKFRVKPLGKRRLQDLLKD